MRKFYILASWLTLILGVCLVVLHLNKASTIDSQYSLVLLIVAISAIVVGYWRHRHPLFVISSLVLTTLGFFVALASEESTKEQHLIETLLFATLLIMGLALFRFFQRTQVQRRTNVVVDGLIVGLGAWLVTWILLVQPALDADSRSDITVLRAIVLATAVLVLFLLSLLVFSRNSRSYSLALLALSVLSALTGIILRAMSFRQDIDISQQDYSTPFYVALVLTASALLHPDSHTLVAPPSTSSRTPLLYRFATISIALIAPIILIAITDPSNLQDRTIRSVSVTLLAVVVMTRVIQSIRENAVAQNNLMRSALTDSLTGLPNRILMLEHIATALQHSWISNKRPTVLFIDVDRFKNINDSLGHSTGDNVLTHVASRLLLSVPEQATVARISGDEFVVLDPTTESPTQSVLLAEKILDSLRSPVPTPGGDMFVTASIGVAYAPRGLDLNADQLLRHADTAMYRAKDAGRNCIALFDDTMLDLVTKRLDVETSLYRALERNELRLVFQPIVDMSLGVVVGFEALMRWNKDSEMVPPSEFIPIAEETGVIVPLGTWAINDSLQQLSTWISSGVVPAGTTMSVNVSAKQLHDPEFITHVRDALRNTSITPEQLLLEVTESVMITETSQALAAMKSLAGLGVRIAVDDFGTGYSSLSVLQQFPIHSIKIDRSFVHRVEHRSESSTLIRTIVAMATALGADVIAEGVETDEQMRFLLSMNCIKAQGYHFCRPIESDFVPQGITEIQNRDTWLDNVTK